MIKHKRQKENSSKNSSRDEISLCTLYSSTERPQREIEREKEREREKSKLAIEFEEGIKYVACARRNWQQTELIC